MLITVHSFRKNAVTFNKWCSYEEDLLKYHQQTMIEHLKLALSINQKSAWHAIIFEIDMNSLKTMQSLTANRSI